MSVTTSKIITFLKTHAKDFTDSKRCFIIVTHIVSNSIDFLEVLASKGRIAGVIAKPNSVDHAAFSKMRAKKIPFINVARDDLRLEDTVKQKIIPLVKEDEKLIIIDTGGYFAPSLEVLNSYSCITGIVEDTENGFQKYEKALHTLSKNNIPIVSIARSYAKDFEDYLVGRFIAKATIDKIHEKFLMNLTPQIGIIGFGEVGRGSAFYLREDKKLKVSIYDKNIEVRKLAKISNFVVISKRKLLETSDILICATGNKSITDKDLRYIKKGCIISSCTSKDDEFDLSTEVSELNDIIFLNGGNAINFTYPEKCTQMLFPYIYLTFSALITCIVKLDRKEIKASNQIKTLSHREEKSLISRFFNEIQSNNDNDCFVNKIKSTNLWRRLECKNTIS